MRQSKFTFQAFLLIVLIFSVLAFFFTHFLSGMADVAWHVAVNDSYEIEGTDLSIRYSDKKPSGIYEGDAVNGVLKVEGTFGHDWGVVLEGDYLYLNEYRTSTFGLPYRLSTSSTRAIASSTVPFPKGSATVFGMSRPSRNIANCRSTLWLNRL